MRNNLTQLFNKKKLAVVSTGGLTKVLLKQRASSFFIISAPVLLYIQYSVI